jgi:hypothetical protein
MMKKINQIEGIVKKILSEAKNDLYVVQYVTGGWKNWKVNTLLPKYTAVEADVEIHDLKKQGYYAVKIKDRLFKSIGGLPYSTEFQTDDEKRKYWDEMLKTTSKPKISRPN